MRGLNLVDQFLFGIINATLLYTLAYALLGFSEQYNAGFAVEDGPVEYGTALFLLFSSFALMWQAAGAASARRVGGVLLLAFYALLFIFGAGEEISWGQRIFGWETTGYFAEHNVQGETTLHNLKVGDEQLAKTLFGSVLTTVVLLYLVVLPLTYPRLPFIAKIADALMVPVPGARHAAIAVIASVLIGIVDLNRKWETYELIFSLLTLSIFLAPQNAHRFMRQS